MNTTDPKITSSTVKTPTIRILLVDDLEIVRMGIRMSLRDEPGVEIVGEAKDGLDALKKARELSPTVILMDIALPEINGIVATKKIKSEMETKVLILSSHEDEKTVFSALEGGADGFCSKEAGAVELITAIKTIANGDTWLSDSIALKVLRTVSEQEDSNEDLLGQDDYRILGKVFEGASLDEIAEEFGLSRMGADRRINNILRSIAAKDISGPRKTVSPDSRSSDSETASRTKYCSSCFTYFDDSVEFCPGCDAELVVDDLIGSIFADRYEIEFALGSGASSTVYKARHRYMNKPVAIKVLHANNITDLEILHRFRQEASSASALEHRNIARVMDFGFTKDGKPFMIMEYTDGLNLEEIIERSGHLEVSDAIPVFMQICDALSCAHSKMILHRDLKPSNILVGRVKEEIVVKVTDFGLAKIMSTGSDVNIHLTKMGQTVGSPTYMSPEQAMGLELTPATDVYALGTLMYETLVGHPPIDSDDIDEVLNHKCRDEVPHIDETSIGPGLPKDLRELIMGCLTRDVENRISNMAEIKSRLEVIQG